MPLVDRLGFLGNAGYTDTAYSNEVERASNPQITQISEQIKDRFLILAVAAAAAAITATAAHCIAYIMIRQTEWRPAISSDNVI